MAWLAARWAPPAAQPYKGGSHHISTALEAIKFKILSKDLLSAYCIHTIVKWKKKCPKLNHRIWGWSVVRSLPQNREMMKLRRVSDQTVANRNGYRQILFLNARGCACAPVGINVYPVCSFALWMALHGEKKEISLIKKPTWEELPIALSWCVTLAHPMAPRDAITDVKQAEACT